MTEFIILFPILIVLAVLWARWDTHGKWHTRYRHSCGYSERLGLGPCPGCGEENAKWTPYITRARFFGGWEEKK